MLRKYMTRNTNVCKQQIQCLMFLFQYMFKTSNFDRYVFVKCHYLDVSICRLARVFVVTSNNKRKIKPMLLKSHPTYKFSTQSYIPFIHDFYMRNFDFQSYIYACISICNIHHINERLYSFKINSNKS